LTQPKVEGIDGGIAPRVVATGESDLDLQISFPIIYPQKSIIFQTDDLNYALGLDGGGGFLNTFFDDIDGSYCTYSAYSETGNAAIDLSIPTQCSLDTRENFNAVFTSLQMSFPSPMESKRTTFQPSINNVSAVK
jgi:hypothetical protein